LGHSSIRVLVVDDFEAFRRLIAETLKQRGELQVVSEASDGLEAVEKAGHLQPDLVLLDISLPKLNGIESARRILGVSPLSRILFISQGLSVDVVHEGLRLGATGFVAKSNLTRDLLKGVDAVLRGETFFSTRLANQHLARTRVAPPRGNVNNKTTSAAVSQQSQKTFHHHAAGFYSNDSHLLDDVSQFVGTALGAGRETIVIATDAHREGLFPRLQMRGLDMTAALQQRRYIALDATEALSTFMVDGLPDRVRFFKLLSDLIATVAAVRTPGQRRVALFGECAHILWTHGNEEGALQLERLGNQLVIDNNIDILCAYSLGTFQGGTGSYAFDKICAEHTAFYSR
jgi:DNA-binding NarL/FixJ family response regulator